MTRSDEPRSNLSVGMAWASRITSVGLEFAVPPLLGAFIGSFIIGFIYTFGTALFPELAYIILFLPMIIVIAFRPRGLFGKVSA